jgi:hypothetical protein
VLDYVGRYTHRIANERMLDIDGERVTFRYTDYRVAGPQKSKTMTLARWKFIRRFLMHVLPTGFHRIRYYRLLGNGHRAQKLTQCRRLLDMAVPGPATSVPAADDRDRLDLLIGGSVRRCPVCQTGHMILIEEQPRPWPFTVRVDSS